MTHVTTWDDPHSPVSVHFIHEGDLTGQVKILTKSDDVVRDEVCVPAEAMEFFARAVLMERLSQVLEENGFV